MNKTKKLRKDYEEHLNILYAESYSVEQLLNVFSHLKSPRLIRNGKVGTAIRKKDNIMFNVGFNEYANSRF